MTNIITTKDLTKSELSWAKILTAGLIIGGLAVFLNSAQMDQKDIPELSLSSQPAQATDGSGTVNFSVSLSKVSLYDLKLKIEYTLDNEKFLPVNLSQAAIDNGSINFNPADQFQVSQINSENDDVNLNFSWETKADPELNNIFDKLTKIKITLLYKLKDVSADTGSTDVAPENNPLENSNLNSDVIIDETQASIGEEAIINDNESGANDLPIDSPGTPSEFAEALPVDLPAEQGTVSAAMAVSTEPVITESAIFSPDSADLNSLAEAIVETVVNEINTVPIETGNTEEIWLENAIVSDNFELDNLAPKIISGILDVKSRKLQITFSEPMATAQIPELTKIVLQNSDGSVNYNIIKGNYDWSAEDVFSMNISLSNIDIAFLTLDEAFQSILVGTKFQAEAGNNLKDLFGNEVFDSSFISLPIENPLLPENKDEEKNDESEKDKPEEIIVPPTTKVINVRGYNKNCSFNPDELIMSAGATSQTELNLIPLDPESKYILTTNTLPNDFAVKILQPSGAGAGPINLEITAPANAAPRLYKLLIKYQDITPQSVSYVHNCVLRLTVE